MTTFTQKVLCCVLLVVSSSPASLARPAANMARIVLWVHDEAEVPQPVVQRAKSVLAHIFRQADLDVKWQAACTPADGEPGPQDCAREEESRYIPVHLVRGTADSSLRHRWSAAAVAVAALPRDGESGEIVLSYGRVEAVVAAYLCDSRPRADELGVALGYLLAHEIGHVLTGGEHAAAGIMSARLFATVEQWKQAMRGSLSFGDREKALLREWRSQLSGRKSAGIVAAPR